MIGHGTSDLNQFFSTLPLASVLVDVRSVPYSKHAQRFNRESLRTNCLTRGIMYKYMGDSLGGRPADPSLYGEDGLLDYELLASSPKFLEGVTELVGLCTNSSGNVYTMCAETAHMQCHRTLVIAPELLKRDIWIHYMNPGGTGPHASILSESDLRVALACHARDFTGTSSASELLSRLRKKIAPKKPRVSEEDFEL